MKEIMRSQFLRFAFQFYTLSAYFPLLTGINIAAPSSENVNVSSTHTLLHTAWKGADEDPLEVMGIPSRYRPAFTNFYHHLGDMDNLKTASSSGGVRSRSKSRSARSYPMEFSPYRYHQRISRHDFNRNSIDPDGGSWGGKWFNKLKRRTSMMMSPSTGFENQGYPYQGEATAEEPDMAATYGGGGHGAGHGGGGGYGKGVNKSAVGLLGFLSLLSLIQNVLNQTQMGRRRRDVTSGRIVDVNFDDADFDQSVTETALLVPLVLPMLNTVAHAQEGSIPSECTLQPICTANQVFLERLGERGKSVGRVLSTKLSKMLTRPRAGGHSYDWDIGGRIIRAGMAGRSGKDCRQLYKKCPETLRLPQMPKFMQRVFI